MSDKRMYILVNEDIKISKGKLAGQVGHAVMVYAFEEMDSGFHRSQQIRDYMENDQKKIILKCSQELLETLEKSEDYIFIRDKGYTQLEPNTLTCVNLGIFDYEEVPEWVQKLKLFH